MITSVNFPLICTVSAIIVAQVLKYPFWRLQHQNEAGFSIIGRTGGMPSSHTAACISLITALIYQYGFISSEVAIATCFSLIIMFDAMGVRRQSGDQGTLAIQLINILRYKANRDKDDELINLLNSFNEKEMIIDDYQGHKPSEVFGGFLTGVFVTILVHQLFIWLA